MSRSKEVFTPLSDSTVRSYHCGPTVYGVQHIGNLRAFVMWDILRRTLEYNGLAVEQVINITDVGHLSSDADEGEDKMTKGLLREGLAVTVENMLALGEKYATIFKEDLAKLNVEMPAAFPRASEHITEDIEIIKALEEKGFTYATSDGVYFDTSKDPNYGKLRTGSVSGDERRSRVHVSSEKRNPEDFALWKLNPELGWESPWGKGFPGWHIECSAMSERYLGLPFDIHTGGIEHIDIHHTNEIAQSENARGKEMARFWLHNNHLQIDSEKISKSLGNTIYLEDIIENNYNPLSLRYFFLTAHYRSEQNFTWQGLQAAENAYNRLINILSRMPDEKEAPDPGYKNTFLEAINDDLNTPQALAVLWDMLRDETIPPARQRATALDLDRVLGLNLAQALEASETIPDAITDLANEREAARTEKDWSRADALREKIEIEGFEIEDSSEGPIIRRKNRE